MFGIACKKLPRTKTSVDLFSRSVELAGLAHLAFGPLLLGVSAEPMSELEAAFKCDLSTFSHLAVDS